VQGDQGQWANKKFLVVVTMNCAKKTEPLVCMSSPPTILVLLSHLN